MTGSGLERPRDLRHRASRDAPGAESISRRRMSAYSRESRPANGHVHEIGVAVVGVAVGEGQLQRLQHGVDVIRGIVAHSLQVAAFQDAQGVEVHRPLAPRAAGVNLYF